MRMICVMFKLFGVESIHKNKFLIFHSILLNVKSTPDFY